ncbi:hypothetical protein T06_16607 [Trichinella sp. T6]|nr:hypothetical protein T06_16607 [Trichinella sp. T6]
MVSFLIFKASLFCDIHVKRESEYCVRIVFFSHHSD